MALKDKIIVRLTGEQRQELEKLAVTGKRSAATITRARILPCSRTRLRLVLRLTSFDRWIGPDYLGMSKAGELGKDQVGWWRSLW